MFNHQNLMYFSVVNGFKINMVKPIILEVGSIMKPTIND